MPEEGEKISGPPIISRRPVVIAFDLDGTLVDTMPSFADLAAQVMHTYHGDDPARARGRYLETSGLPFEHQLEIIHPGHESNRQAAEEFEARKQEICATTPVLDRTLTAVRRLRALGIRLVVTSNTGQNVADKLGLRQYSEFDLVLGYDAESGLAKGESHFDRIQRQFGVSTDEILFVGDSINDGRIARLSRIRFIGVVGTFSRDEFERELPGVPTIDHIEVLADLLEKGRLGGNT